MALAVAAVPAGVALAGSGGQSSGSEGQAPDATFIQDETPGETPPREAPEGQTPPGDGERRDGHDCPKDRQGPGGPDTGYGAPDSGFDSPDTTQL